MLRIFILFPLMLAIAAIAPGTAFAVQFPASLGPQASGIVTIDAAQLESVAPLDAAWRYQSGDDPQYADISFDDSAWPVLRSGRTLASAGMPVFKWGNAWIRLRLHLENTTVPLGINLETLGGQQYEVFANGRRIAASRGVLAGIRQRSSPFTIALPAASDIVLAIRFTARPSLPAQFFPLTLVRIGPLGAMLQATELERIRNVDGGWLANVFDGTIYLLFLPIGLTLFLTRRDHAEYLWIAILCTVGSMYLFLSVADGIGAMPETNTNVAIYLYCGWGTMIAGLEFVRRFTGTQRLLAVRILQAAIACGPLLFFMNFYATYDAALALCLIAWVVIVVLHLSAAYRNGHVEAGLLLIPFAIIPASELLTLLADHFPTLVPFRSHVHIGNVGLGLNDLGSLLFVFGIFAVVLNRFVRTSRNEQRASAELEAASTVQKVLIPKSVPTLPGYLIGNAYQPAQQVGGDFFQIIPIPAENAALIVLGDVSGKGLEAAMTVALIVGAIRSLVDYVHSPSGLMAGLNRDLHGRSAGFTTCIIMRIDAAGRVIAANAGHLSPYLQGVELELETGLPLGLALDTCYPESVFLLPAGQSLTLLTDGVVEAMNAKTHELFGFDRTQAVSTQSASEIAQAARSFGAGAPQADDITVLTICVDTQAGGAGGGRAV